MTSSELRQRKGSTDNSQIISDDKTITQPNKFSALMFKVCFLVLEVLFIFLMTQGKLFGLFEVGFGWPVVSLGDTEEYLKILWNVEIFVLWGFAHSLSAQPWFQTKAAGLSFLEKTHVFVVGSGVAAIITMMLWQPYEDEDTVIWDINMLPWTFTLYENTTGGRIYLTTYAVFDVVVHFMALGQIGKLLERLSGLSKADRKSAAAAFEKKQIVSDGWYGVVRHPVYTIMMIMLVVTLRMSIGRICVMLAFMAYLIPGVYFEEKRLEDEFGQEVYQEYREKVPSKFLPFIY